MQKIILILIIVIYTNGLKAQKFYTKEGKISFYSEAPIEKIEAHNSKATAVLDLESGKMEWAVLIKGFEFEKALMQDHFNENYMESTKYPKSNFKGQISNWTPIDLSKEGSTEVTVQGKLTIRGITKNISTPVSLVVNNRELTGKSTFSLKVADYGIKIPGIVKDKIAKEVNITVDAHFTPLDSKS